MSAGLTNRLTAHERQQLVERRLVEFPQARPDATNSVRIEESAVEQLLWRSVERDRYRRRFLIAIGFCAGQGVALAVLAWRIFA